jgi:hypothetical protein
MDPAQRRIMPDLAELPRTTTVTRSAGVFHQEWASFEVTYAGEDRDDLIEEPLDTTPILGHLGAPSHPAEEWPDGSGPAGF